MYEDRSIYSTATLVLTAFAVAIPHVAAAHPLPASGGFAAGLAHPWLGMDHILAALAVGMWAGQVGRAAMWSIPAAFLAAMIVGAGLASAGIGLPAAAAVPVLSVLALGAAIALPRRAHVLAAPAAVILFATFHGHAHMTELPPHASALAYGLGLVLATASIHLAGVAAAAAAVSFRAAPLLRAAGAAIALAGAVMTVAAFAVA